MTPKIETSIEKKLVGKKMKMSYADYRIGELWVSFMPRRKEITNSVNNDLISSLFLRLIQKEILTV